MNNYVVRMADGGIIGGLDRLGTLSGNVKQALSNIVYGGGGQGGQSSALRNFSLGSQQPSFSQTPPLLPAVQGPMVENNPRGAPMLESAVRSITSQPMQASTTEYPGFEGGAMFLNQTQPAVPGDFASNIESEMSTDSPYFNMSGTGPMQPLQTIEPSPEQQHRLNALGIRPGLGVNSPNYASNPLGIASVFQRALRFGEGGAVSLGAGEPGYVDMGSLSMNDMFATPSQPGDEYYVGEFPGRVYREGDQITDPYYEGPNYSFEAEDPRRFDLYEDSDQFAPPLTDQGIIPFDEEGRARPTYPSFQEYMETDDSGNVGIMASLGKDEDTTGPLQADPDYSGIEAFDIYQGLAPEQFKRRRIQDQKFDKKRGFKFGQMVRLDAMDNKLMKMGGASPRSFSPEVADQMYIVLGRDVG
jgi:hypothetical protein